MKMKMRHYFKPGVVLAMVLAGGLTGCASGPQPLYQWGSYQPELYKYFKGESHAAQIAQLEADMQKILASGKKLPPGFNAQLGLLYAGEGKDDQAMKAFQAEKSAFPEAGPYMDFLMSKKKG